MWATFLQWVDDNDRTIDKSCYELAQALSEHIRCGEIEAAAACYKNLVLKVGEVQDLLAEFAKANEDKPTIHGPCVFSPGIHTGTEMCDWMLYMPAYKSTMPRFAAYDHTTQDGVLCS